MGPDVAVLHVDLYYGVAVIIAVEVDTTHAVALLDLLLERDELAVGLIYAVQTTGKA